MEERDYVRYANMNGNDELRVERYYGPEGELNKTDGPAITYANGLKLWLSNSEFHRDGGPAVEHANGEFAWYSRGLLHRDGDLPASVEDDTGPDGHHFTHLKYCKSGLLHRDNGEPALITIDMKTSEVCGQEWWISGKCHRDGDRPAKILPDGTLEWWVNGLRHRENDMPAVEYATWGKEWWVNGKHHRDGDKPAIIGYPIPGDPYAKQDLLQWYKDNSRCRENDQPSVIECDGSQWWCQREGLEGAKWWTHPDGAWWINPWRYGRRGGPAIITPAGSQIWLLHGAFHNPNGPAIVLLDEDRQWWRDYLWLSSYCRHHIYNIPENPEPQEWWLCGKKVPPFTENAILTVTAEVKEVIAQ